MSDHRRETAFLKNCLLYDSSDGRQELLSRIIELERNERCVKRAVRVMMVLVALALSGLGYSAILVTHYPTTPSIFIEPFIIKVFGALSVASMACLLAFVGLGMLYRRELNHGRHECRRLIAGLLQSQFGRVDATGASRVQEKKLMLKPVAFPTPPS